MGNHAAVAGRLNRLRPRADLRRPTGVPLPKRDEMTCNSPEVFQVGCQLSRSPFCGFKVEGRAPSNAISVERTWLTLKSADPRRGFLEAPNHKGAMSSWFEI